MQYLIGFIGGIMFYVLIIPIMEMAAQWINTKLQIFQNVAQKDINDMFAEPQEQQPAIGFTYQEPYEEEYYEYDEE